ncbi:MAG TPA: glycoside hydrolase family 16 protein [Novosphingobium sp.]|nr:glycoside hydrolase family 16 protein [Novosphingobium sp.]
MQESLTTKPGASAAPISPARACAFVVLVATALCVAAWGGRGAAYAAPVAALPAVIDPGTFGPPSFDEDFAHFDAGTDQTRPAHPHRWRTVKGDGGPAAPANRAMSAMSLAVDADYRGTDNGAPLGINPFTTGPQGLTITARKVSPALQARMFGRQWASGLLTTKFSFEQHQGYFEADMDLPVCQKGAWPAFWVVPAKGPWPLHGEIDMPETIGDGKIHWGTISGATGRKEEAHVVTPGDCSRSWHRYGMLWQGDSVGYYYDRHLVGQAKAAADYTEPMYIILNLAVGGSWPGPPDPAATQITMRVRRVSAWPLLR